MTIRTGLGMLFKAHDSNMIGQISTFTNKILKMKAKLLLLK